MFERIKRMLGVAENEKLSKWRAKLDTAKEQYAKTIDKMKTYEDYYEGTRSMQANPNTGKVPTKDATNVRNIVLELIESQIDSAIPMPKVRAVHETDAALAKKIEHLLEEKVVTCNLMDANDLNERVTPVIGGDFYLVEWDPNLGRHSELGDLTVKEVHPTQLIPQPGVTDFDKMDYFFVQNVMTRKAVERFYGKSVHDAENTEPDLTQKNANDVVTVNIAYYRNDHGGIGRYTWCDFIELEDYEDYQSRHLDRCAKCGAVMKDGKCPECGSKKSKKMPEDYEELVKGIEIDIDGGGRKQIDPTEVIPEIDENGNPVMETDENGNPLTDAFGQPAIKVKHVSKKVPYYKPDIFPVVLRRNITKRNSLVGSSDVSAIIDQQDTIKKLGTKVNEKLLKGGSFVTLPRGVKVELTDEELKILRINNPQEKGLIDVLNVQPNVTNDENYLEVNYQWAKSTLGITDAYQGKYDASARSGTAKQFSINQAAGRLESKRTMKNSFYGKLYEVMFKFWLAYSDQDNEISFKDSEGKSVHESINRHEFLKMDKSGEFYWNDEFIFETDPTSTMMANREAMWNQADLKLQSAAFGPLGDLQTLKLYWAFMKANDYPNAGAVLTAIEERIEEANAMQQMSNGNADQIEQPGIEEGEDLQPYDLGMPE